MRKANNVEAINTYIVTIQNFGSKTVQAKTRGAAKYAAFLEYDPFGYGFGNYVGAVESVRLVHRFRPSDLYGDIDMFERMKVARGIPYCNMGSRVLAHMGKRGDMLGTVVGSTSGQNLLVCFDGTTHGENCHPHYQMYYLDDDGNIVASFFKEEL